MKAKIVYVNGEKQILFYRDENESIDLGEIVLVIFIEAVKSKDLEVIKIFYNAIKENVFDKETRKIILEKFRIFRDILEKIEEGKEK